MTETPATAICFVQRWGRDAQGRPLWGSPAAGRASSWRKYFIDKVAVQRP